MPILSVTCFFQPKVISQPPPVCIHVRNGEGHGGEKLSLDPLCCLFDSKTMLVYQNFYVLSEFIEYCNRKWVSQVFRSRYFHYKQPQSHTCSCLNQLFISHPPPSFSSDPQVTFSARSCKSWERCAQLITWRHYSPHLNKWCVSFGPVPTASCDTSATAPAAPPEEWKFITMWISIGDTGQNQLEIFIWLFGLHKSRGSQRKKVSPDVSFSSEWFPVVVGGACCFSFFPHSDHQHVTKGFNFWAQLLPFLPACSSAAAAGKF